MCSGGGGGGLHETAGHFTANTLEEAQETQVCVNMILFTKCLSSIKS